MKRKIRYTDAPKEIEESMARSVDVTDWFHQQFPMFSPEALAVEKPRVKVTITLGVDSVNYFKSQAKKLKVPYQRMIRNLIDRYTETQIMEKSTAAPMAGRGAGKVAKALKAK